MTIFSVFQKIILIYRPTATCFSNVFSSFHISILLLILSPSLPSTFLHTNLGHRDLPWDVLGLSGCTDPCLSKVVVGLEPFHYKFLNNCGMKQLRWLVWDLLIHTGTSPSRVYHIQCKGSKQFEEQEAFLLILDYNQFISKHLYRVKALPNFSFKFCLVIAVFTHSWIQTLKWITSNTYIHLFGVCLTAYFTLTKCILQTQCCTMSIPHKFLESSPLLPVTKQKSMNINMHIWWYFWFNITNIILLPIKYKLRSCCLLQ